MSGNRESTGGTKPIDEMTLLELLDMTDRITEELRLRLMQVADVI